MALSGLLLFLAIICVAVGTLIPFGAPRSCQEVAAVLHGPITLSVDSPIWLTLVERLVSFCSIGLLLQWTWDRRGSRRSTVWACLTVAAVVVSLELAQAFVPGRHARLSDAALGIVMGLVGVAIARSVHRRLDGVVRAYERRQRPILSLLLGAGNVVVIAIVLQAHRGVGLRGWDRDYPLLIANERTQDRPWLGGIRGVVIHDRELSGEEIAESSRITLSRDRRLPRRDRGVVASYDFARTENGQVPSALPDAQGPPILLPRGSDPGWRLMSDGIEIRRPLFATSAAPADALCDALLKSGAFTIEAVVAAVDARQAGPARIVSISVDQVSRNVTLSQAMDRLDLRVRTPRTGVNGSDVLCRSRSGALAGGAWQHIAATFGNGRARLWADGREVRRPLRLYRVETMLFRNDATPLALLAAVVLFCPLAWLAGAILVERRMIGAMLWGIALTLALPLGASVAVTGWLGRDQDWAFLISAFAVWLATFGMVRGAGGGLSARDESRDSDRSVDLA
ncbi:MAG: hypothetical protein JXQ73_05455 [Phycisphaerae bacterium]|nr:hypothetical protein [Phycisphaerae bacterium]